MIMSYTDDKSKYVLAGQYCAFYHYKSTAQYQQTLAALEQAGITKNTKQYANTVMEDYHNFLHPTA